MSGAFKWIPIILLLLLLIAGTLIIVIQPSQSILNFLSKTDKVDANLLLVEGWLPNEALEQAMNEFRSTQYDHIITTGNFIPDNYYTIYGSGYLTFYTENQIPADEKILEHKIEVEAYSSLEGENCAHFDLFVNDSLSADFYVNKTPGRYGITWKGKLADIDSVMIHFDNDKWGKWGNRDLYVKEIIFDNKIHIPYFIDSKYDYMELDGRDKVIFNYASYAELARARLIGMGIDSASVISVPGEMTQHNRTLKSALSFRKWLKNSDLKVEGINIVSLGIHSRRTWMVYKRVLGKEYKTGIISIPDSKIYLTEENSRFSNLREILGIIYYWIITIPL